MAWAIQNRLPKRQAVLFLLVLAAPCLVLTGLGFRMNQQEGQLAQKRAEDERLHRLALFRSDLLSELESVKRKAAAGHWHEAVVLVGAVRDGNLALPYENGAYTKQFRRSLEEMAFGSRIRRGEQEELVGRRFDQAAEQYRAAVAESRLPWEKAYAGLLVARSEQKAGRQAEARAQYQAVLRSPPELRDEYGIPLALFAAAALVESGADRGEIVTLLGRLVRDSNRLGPPALSMMRDLAGEAGAADLLPEQDRSQAGCRNALSRLAHQYPS